MSSSGFHIYYMLQSFFYFRFMFIKQNEINMEFSFEKTKEITTFQKILQIKRVIKINSNQFDVVTIFGLDII